MTAPYRVALLDTPAEEAFDRLTRLAARLLGAPVALVSLMDPDQDRQFFKSAIGLPEPWASRRSAPSSYAFCRHIAHTREPFAVDDARQDPLTRQNPAIRELGWIASLGVPLVSRDGQTLGVMSVVDTIPRLWSVRDGELLRDLAASVVTEIELRAEFSERRAERRAAEPTEHDEPFADPFRDAGAGIGVLSLDGRWLRVNRALGGLLGYDPDDLAGRTLASITHPDDVAVEREAARLLRAGECPSYQVETRYRHRSGETVWVLVTAAVVRRPDGEPDHLVTVVQDVTERRQIESTSVMPEVVREWDLPSDRMTWPADGVFGYSRDALGATAAGWYERIHAGDRERVVTGIAGAISRGDRSWTDDYRFRSADGTYIPVRDRAVITYDETGAPTRFEAAMVVTGRAPSGGRTVAGHLRQMQKMEAVGQLAGGIAHDFNNLLTGIMSYCDLILQELRHDDPIRDDVEQIRHAGVRAATLTRQLLAFSRRQILQPQVVSLNDVVDDLAAMLRRMLGTTVTLEPMLERGLWPVFADPGQLEQVVINLIGNARDAVPAGGRVTVATANIALEAPIPTGSGTLGPGEYVLLSVSDTGVGMDRVTQARIFEPFFTTKASGQGTGLGMATVLGIVQQSGGEIAVESAPGEGAVFRVYLPRYRGSASAVPRPIRQSLPRGNETVLLVDDEADVRASVRRLLERYGYTVLEARHGVEALPLFQANAARLDLLVTDVVMPEMGGRELVERLRTFFPALKVLFMSGYTENAFTVDDRLPPNTGFLEKPFTIDHLLWQVREILDSGVSAG